MQKFGPHERVKRANRQIAILQQSLKRFFDDNSYEIIVAEYNSKTDDYSLRVKSGPDQCPGEWSLLIGEIAHNLRAALDGLAWKLALLKTNRPFERTAFPICRVGRGKRRRKGSSGLHREFWGSDVQQGVLRSIDRRFRTRIEAFQPYKRGQGGRLSPLFLLQELNNADKHRLITVLVMTSGAMTFSGASGGTRLKVGVPLRPDAKVGSMRDVPPPSDEPGRGRIYVLNLGTGKLEHPKMQASVTVTPSVRFGDSCDAVVGLPVIGTLRKMADEVSCVIESFTDKLS